MKPQQGILTSYKRLKDKSVNVTFNLNEISSEDMTEIDSELDTFGVVYFSQKSTLTDKEKEAIDLAEVEIRGKTKSKRLYNVIWVYCQQNRLDFEKVYPEKMEEFIQMFKDELHD